MDIFFSKFMSCLLKSRFLKFFVYVLNVLVLANKHACFCLEKKVNSGDSPCFWLFWLFFYACKIINTQNYHSQNYRLVLDFGETKFNGYFVLWRWNVVVQLLLKLNVFSPLKWWLRSVIKGKISSIKLSQVNKWMKNFSNNIGKVI